MASYPSLHDPHRRAEGCRHLLGQDVEMARCVRRYGDVWPARPRSAFDGLARMILDQQISVFAAATIRARLQRRLKNRTITPAGLRSLSPEDYRAAGVSRPKARYLGELARADLGLPRLRHLDDQAVIESLTRHTGIGRWTAQMYLLFVLGRGDVLADGDLGLVNAARALYGFANRPTPREFEALAESWRPYRSLASTYLWASLELGNWKPRPSLV